MISRKATYSRVNGEFRAPVRAALALWSYFGMCLSTNILNVVKLLTSLRCGRRESQIKITSHDLTLLMLDGATM